MRVYKFARIHLETSEERTLHMRHKLVSSVLMLATVFVSGCGYETRSFPKNYVHCLEKALVETQHQAALGLALDHCRKLDPKGEAEYRK